MKARQISRKGWARHIAAAAAVAVLGVGLSPITQANAELEPGLTGLVEQTSTESIVLLKNENNVLPLSPSRVLSVFGRVQVDYFPNGFGSGGDVKYTYATDPLTALRRNPGVTVNEDLAKLYETWCAEHTPDKGGWATWPRSYPEMPLSNQVVSDASDVSDTALVFIGRSLGESMEQMNGKGGFTLTDAEMAMLTKVNNNFPNIIVAINAGNQIDMSWVSQFNNIKGMLAVWQGGQEAGYSLARIIAGDENPSGKLPDTWAYELTDYPSTGQFGYGVNNPIYQEDIFLGYRYFETFAQDRVLYPFGFGLSYTSFQIDTGAVTSTGGRISIPVTVTNTGARAGKEVVQVYHGAPQGALGKASRSLIAYAKTGLLAPGATESLTLSFPISEMASYDDAGKTGNKSAWVLEAGDYPLYVGNSVRAPQASVYRQAALQITKQEVETLAALVGFNRWHAQDDGSGGVELVKNDPVPTTTNAVVAARMRAAVEATPEFAQTAVDQGIKLIDVYNDPSKMNAFIAQMTPQELAWLTTGAGTMDAPTSVLGSAGVYGGYIPELQKYGIPSLTLTDGPSGIRISAAVTQLSIGTALAATWNDKLVEDLYAGVGREMIRNGSTALLAPGMDMHRNPLGGRNFEYMSEDPLLTGNIGAAFIRGLEGVGAGATPKHFALNEQETARGSGNSAVSERAQREIYLRAFEIAIKASDPSHLMTAYNQISGHFCNRNWQLTTSILRDEWGYNGLVMSDWGGVGSGQDPTGLSSGPARLRAGMNLLEQGSPGDTTILNSLNHTGTAPSSGLWLRMGELQQNVKTILNVALKTTKFRDEHGLPRHTYATGEYNPTYRWFAVDQVEQTVPRLTSISVGGQPLPGFVSTNIDYPVFTPAGAPIPAVTATGAPGVTVSYIPATAARRATDIIATTADGGRTLYRLYFDNLATRPNFHPSDTSADLVGISVNGAEVSNFYPSTYDYVVWTANAATAAVTATAKSGATATATRTPGANDWNIRVESATQAHVYTVSLGDIDAAKQPASDPLTGTALDPKWSVANSQPINVAATAEGVRINTSSSEWQLFGVDNIRNVIYQQAQGNWTATVKATVSGLPSQLGQSYGIVLFDDLNGSYVKNGISYVAGQLTAVAGGNPATGPWYQMTNGYNGLYAYATAAAAPTTVWFRFVKNGESIQASTSVNGTTFTNRGSGNALNTFLSNPKIGLYATQAAGNSQLSVTFSDFTVANLTPAAFPAVRETVVTAAGESKMFADSRFASRGTFSTAQVGDNVWAAGGHSTFPSGEFNHALYNLDVQAAGNYVLTPRTYSAVNRYSKWGFDLHVDGNFINHYEGVGAKAWGPMEPGKTVYLTAGRHKVRIGCWTTTAFQLSGISIEPSGASNYKDTLAAIASGYQLIAGQEDQYTPASWAPFAQAWADTQAALAGTTVSQAQFTDLTTRLESTAAALQDKPVDYSTLEQLIVQANAKLATPDAYLPAGVAALRTAVSSARTLIDSGTATQDQVNAEAISLARAISAVLPRGDKAALQSLVNVVSAIDGSRYTPGTWTAVTAALTAANTVLANDNASINDIETATTGLNTALAGLVPKAAKAGLKTAIDVADSILASQSLYVVSSLAGLSEARSAANYVYLDDNATTAQVTAAQTALIVEIAEVRLRNASALSLAGNGSILPASVAVKAALDPAAVSASLDLAAFAKAPKPKIKGVKAVGKKLRAKAGSWSPAAQLSYQWYRGGKAITKATKAAYTLKTADRGKKISVKVTASKDGYATTVKASAKTKKIK